MKETGPTFMDYLIWGWLGVLFEWIGPPGGWPDSAWAVRARCLDCGTGTHYGPPDPKVHAEQRAGNNRWLCAKCGAPVQCQVPWIGRYWWWGWEWKPENELPEDLKPKKASPPPDPTEEEIRARVEVEVALRLAKQRAHLGRPEGNNDG